MLLDDKEFSYAKWLEIKDLRSQIEANGKRNFVLF